MKKTTFLTLAPGPIFNFIRIEVADNIRILVSLLAIILFCSCNKVKEKPTIISIDTFPIEKQIQGVPHEIYNSPETLINLDNFIFVYNSKKSNIFSVFDKKNLSLISEFGTRGKGPGEILSFSSSNQFTSINGNSCLWYFDRQRRILNLMDVGESIKNKSTKILKSINHTYETSIVDNIFVLNDTLVLGTSNGGKGLLFQYNSKSEKLNWKPYLSN